MQVGDKVKQGRKRGIIKKIVNHDVYGKGAYVHFEGTYFSIFVPIKNLERVDNDTQK